MPTDLPPLDSLEAFLDWIWVDCDHPDEHVAKCGDCLYAAFRALADKVWDNPLGLDPNDRHCSACGAAEAWRLVPVCWQDGTVIDMRTCDKCYDDAMAHGKQIAARSAEGRE